MRIAVITSGFPRRSETFALHELLALEEAGMLAGAFATKSGDGLPPHPDAARLRTPVRVLPEAAVEAQADLVATELRGRPVDAVHGYFAHKPAAVAAAVARRLGVPFGFSIHARDARKIGSGALSRQAEAAACVIACNADVAGELEASNGHVHVVPHGVDVARFAPRDLPRRRVARALAVGRLVEKKGFGVLLEAATRVTSPLEFRIVGEGPERARLQRQISAAGLDGRVALVGSCTHEALPREYAAADLVVAPSIHDGTGDRDGLPNVVLEAMASARPVVATTVGAIPSAVEHGRTGWLVEPNDADALARSIDVLARSRDLRARAGRAARAKVERDFALADCTARLRRVLEESYA